MNERPVISFLTDFGPESAPAICRGVMLSIAPDAQIVDITHTLRKFAIHDGAYLLWSAVPWMPIGTHVVVVDPGVGTARRAVAIRTARGDVLVGPDNGVLMPAAAALGGAVEARHLAAGAPFESLGDRVELEDLVQFAFPGPTVGSGVLETSVLFVDSFGNIRFAGVPSDLEKAIGPLAEGRLLEVTFRSGDGSPALRTVVPWGRTFGDRPLGDSLLYENSFGNLALADNQGNAAARLGVSAGMAVTVRPA
jgi:S-adenosylmethionine hydrolase